MAVAADQYAAYVVRIEQYLIKAARESKVSTSWISPNEVYESGLRNFVRGILSRESAFIKDLTLAARRIAEYGCWNSLPNLC